LKKNYQILIIFDIDIFDTTGDETIVQFSTASIVCFYSTCGNKNKTKYCVFIQFRLFGFRKVVQKQTIGKVETKTVI